MNDNELTAEEWDALTERERAAYLDDARDEYLAECSREQRVRFEWENGA
jgi:hypothetical protein